MIEPVYVTHEFSGIDHNVGRCPACKQPLVLTMEYCGDYMLACPRQCGYRAVQRAPLVEGAPSKWDAPPSAPADWQPPVRRVA